MGKATGKPTAEQIEERRQTLLWRQLAAKLQKMHQDINEMFVLTIPTLSQLCGTPVEVRVESYLIHLRWNSSYKFHGTRSVRFPLTEARIEQFAAVARDKLIERLNALGCPKR